MTTSVSAVVRRAKQTANEFDGPLRRDLQSKDIGVVVLEKLKSCAQHVIHVQIRRLRMSSVGREFHAD